MVQTFFPWIMKYISDLLDQNRHSMHSICICFVPFSANVGLFLEIICEFIAEGFKFFYSYLNLFSDEIFSLQASTKKQNKIDSHPEEIKVWKLFVYHC